MGHVYRRVPSLLLPFRQMFSDVGNSRVNAITYRIVATKLEMVWEKSGPVETGLAGLAATALKFITLECIAVVYHETSRSSICEFA